MKLLSRDEFRALVLGRNGGHCCVLGCAEPSVDAHHILERRLWTAPHEIGGYFLANGAGVCGDHHYQAEQTVLSASDLREWCGIGKVVLPEAFYPDSEYTKWGDPILKDGTRLPGPLFWDESVQKVLGSAEGVLGMYRGRVKYPRSYHLPWSQDRSDDDKTLRTVDGWVGIEYVVTAKEDGENTTVYPGGYVHARSTDSLNDLTRERVVAEAQVWAHHLPKGWRVVGENMTAVHSIAYQNLPARFLVHSIWERDRALPWDEMIEWCELLGLTPVEVLWGGVWTPNMEPVLTGAWRPRDGETVSEGYVCRPAGSYLARDHSRVVGKFVRAGHVSDGSRHWRHQQITYNTVRG